MSKLPALVACLMLTGALTFVSTPAEAASDSSKRWSGYKISKTSRAASGWIGAYKTRGKVTYRIDPAAKASASKRYKSAKPVSSLKRRGGGKVPASKRARAAWILSKYGAYKSSAQTAAVEISVNSLLGGKSSSLSSKATKKRLRQSKHGTSIKYLARRMLRDSSAQAGPYAAVVTVPAQARVGTAVVARVQVYSTRSRRGVGNLPVAVQLGGQKQGATTLTDSQGRASVSLVAAASGRQTVTASVTRVPAQRLEVMRSKRKGGSRLVVAGKKGVLRATRTVGVFGTPYVTALTSVYPTISVGGTQQARFKLVDATTGSPRTATGTLHGPFRTPEAATCTGAVAATRTVQVNGSGTYSFPGVATGAAGWWATGVSVAGDGLNAAVVRTCGARTKVFTRPKATVTRDAISVSQNASIRSTVKITGWTPLAAATAKVTLYGPYKKRSSISCGTTYKSVYVTVRANGSIRTPAIKVGKTGYYGWRVALPATTFTTASTSGCDASNTVVKVN